MSSPTKEDIVENLEFVWRQKKGVGGKKKDVQFYVSFAYDGVEYTLYDSVYLYKDGEPAPYVGIIVKIWETPVKSKKVKILWFFRPWEILNYLKDEVPPENELFLACGEGVGLANVNPLEAIAGKCNVVCISKDKRNPQPSEEQRQMAEFFFYRTFDVVRHTVSDIFDDKIAGLDVKDIFNRTESEIPKSVPNFDSDKKENSKIALPVNETLMTSVQLINNVLEEIKLEHKINVGKGDGCSDNFTFNQVEVEEKVKVNGDVDIRPFKKAKIDSSIKSPKNKNNEGCSGNFTSNQVEVEEVKVNGDVDIRPFKKAKIDSSIKSPKNKNNDVVENSSRNEFYLGNVKTLPMTTNSEDGKLSKIVTGMVEDNYFKYLKPDEKNNKVPSKHDEKISKIPNGKLLKASNIRHSEKDNKGGDDTQIKEVTRRPDADRSRWFKGVPWEERLQNACKQETLVLLENLDPTYTSAEVEDIVWHGFKEICTAKMIQSTGVSTPHSGQAFIVLKTREAAEKVVEKLEQGCLMLSNRRPLVGSFGNPCLPKKESTLVGHLAIDRLKMQRGMKEAVSTSHCSQPNTIEYEMAMEWCLLQERSASTWRKMFKRQGEEARKLKSELKPLKFK